MTSVSSAQPSSEIIEIDPSSPAHPFPHFWERMFGSGRAILSLRESYRRDLREVKRATNFDYIRFHAIFHDEVGVYDEGKEGRPIYNFSYVDQIYDGLLANGIRPFVELGFMPRKLASDLTPHPFWYKPYPSPPRDWDRWGELVEQFTRHLVARYGISEVARWYFEVWNEPNIDFWTGVPKESTYYHLYDVSARAVKRVDLRIRVGGPATAQAAWIDPGVCDNKVGYWHVAGPRLVYRQHGRIRSIGIASLISWRGRWYVVHLGAVLRSTPAGVVDQPADGPGTPGPPGGC